MLFIISMFHGTIYDEDLRYRSKCIITDEIPVSFHQVTVGIWETPHFVLRSLEIKGQIQKGNIFHQNC